MDQTIELCQLLGHYETPKNCICIEKNCSSKERVGCLCCFQDLQVNKSCHKGHKFALIKQVQDTLEKNNAFEKMQEKEQSLFMNDNNMMLQIDEYILRLKDDFEKVLQSVRQQWKTYVTETYQQQNIYEEQQRIKDLEIQNKVQEVQNFVEMMKIPEQIEKYLQVYNNIIEGNNLDQVFNEQQEQQMTENQKLKAQVQEKLDDMKNLLELKYKNFMIPGIEKVKKKFINLFNKLEFSRYETIELKVDDEVNVKAIQKLQKKVCEKKYDIKKINIDTWIGNYIGQTDLCEEGVQDFIKQKLMKLLQQIKQNTNNVQYFTFNVNSYKVKRNFVSVHGQYHFKYTDIESRVCDYLSGDELLQKVTEVIEKQKMLIHIDVEFNGEIHGEFSDKGLINLSQALKRHEKLKTLCLDFYANQDFSDEGLNNLSYSLKQHEQLENLSLDFNWNQGFSDEGLNNLSQALKQHEKLKALSLDFSDNNNFSDEGLKNLSQALKKHEDLETLCLNFECNQDFSDEGLNNLSQTLKQHKELQTLSLNFFGNDNFSDEGFKNLSQALKQHKKLSTLSLTFNRLECYDLEEFIEKYNQEDDEE